MFDFRFLRRRRMQRDESRWRNSSAKTDSDENLRASRRLDLRLRKRHTTRRHESRASAGDLELGNCRPFVTVVPAKSSAGALHSGERAIMARARLHSCTYTPSYPLFELCVISSSLPSSRWLIRPLILLTNFTRYPFYLNFFQKLIIFIFNEQLANFNSNFLSFWITWF